jgi:hypothetical protein
MRKGLWSCFTYFYTGISWWMLALGCCGLLKSKDVQSPFDWFFFVTSLAVGVAFACTVSIWFLLRSAKPVGTTQVRPVKQLSPVRSRQIMSLVIGMMATGQIAMLALLIRNAVPSIQFLLTWLIAPIVVISPLVYFVMNKRAP